MGKYDEVLPTLPRYVDPERESQREKINAKKAEILKSIRATDAQSLVKEYGMLRREKARIQEELSKLNVNIMAYEELMSDAYEQTNTKSVKIMNGDSVRMQPEPHAQVLNRDEFRAWCIKNDMLNQLALPWQTTNAMTKELLLEGQEPPPGVKAFVRTKYVFTKGD